MFHTKSNHEEFRPKSNCKSKPKAKQVENSKKRKTWQKRRFQKRHSSFRPSDYESLTSDEYQKRRTFVPFIKSNCYPFGDIDTSNVKKLNSTKARKIINMIKKAAEEEEKYFDAMRERDRIDCEKYFSYEWRDEIQQRIEHLEEKKRKLCLKRDWNWDKMRKLENEIYEAYKLPYGNTTSTYDFLYTKYVFKKIVFYEKNGVLEYKTFVDYKY